MTVDELKALLGPMLAEAVKPISDRLDQVEKDNKDRVEAGATTRALVEPHATALEGCAAAMEAAGVGTDPKFGHVHVLRRMSDSMRAEAAVGKVPHVWRDHDYPTYASAEPNKDEIDMTKDEVSTMIASAVESAVKPLTEQLKATEDKLAQGKRGQECGGTTAGAEVPRVQLHGWSRYQAHDRAEISGAVQAANPGGHAKG